MKQTVAEFFRDSEEALVAIVAKAMRLEHEQNPGRQELLDDDDIPHILAIAQERLVRDGFSPPDASRESLEGTLDRGLSWASSQVCVEKVRDCAERLISEGKIEEGFVDGARTLRWVAA